jgi:hypothetical protein
MRCKFVLRRPDEREAFRLPDISAQESSISKSRILFTAISLRSVVIGLRECRFGKSRLLGRG